MPRTNRILAALGVLLMSGAALPASPAVAGTSPVRVVQPGGSIQAALDASAPGTTVVVRPGEYRENLEIVKDGITLLGSGATLRPPEPAQPRRCSTASGLPTNGFGLCIAGELVAGRPPTVVRPVRGVTVRGLAVEDFALTAITVMGGDHTRIQQTRLEGGGSYGVLLSSSSHSTVTGNRVIGGSSAGIYVGDSPQAHAVVTGNQVSGEGFLRIYVRDAAHGRVTANTVEGGCIGIGFVATALEPGGTTDWVASGNLVRRNNTFCAASGPGDVPLTGIGFMLTGADHVTVSHNLIQYNQVAPGAAPWGGGIVLRGGRHDGLPEPTNNRIVGNVLHHNAPSDITLVVPGTGNEVAGNVCRVSSPDGLCSRRN